MTLQTQVFNTLDQLLPSKTRTIVVAVSGGADSLALTLLANEYAVAKGLRTIAVTVDHMLRHESADEAAWVNKTLGGLGIEHQILKWQHDAHPNRLHENARTARYQLMINFCHEYQNPALLTAHHKQDQVETILMRFLHGSGAAGFGGIQPFRFQNGMVIVRPLLGIEPQFLRDYLVAKGQKWVEDPSNVDTKYERTRVRQLLQHISDLWGQQGILESAAKICEIQDAFDEIIEMNAANFIIHNSIDSITINQIEFFKCHAHVQHQWLRNKIWQIGQATYPKPYKTIDAILKMLKQPRVNDYKVAGCSINVKKKELTIRRFPPA